MLFICTYLQIEKNMIRICQYSRKEECPKLCSEKRQTGQTPLRSQQVLRSVADVNFLPQNLPTIHSPPITSIMSAGTYTPITEIKARPGVHLVHRVRHTSSGMLSSPASQPPAARLWKPAAFGSLYRLNRLFLHPSLPISQARKIAAIFPPSCSAAVHPLHRQRYYERK